MESLIIDNTKYSYEINDKIIYNYEIDENENEYNEFIKYYELIPDKILKQLHYNNINLYLNT